MDQSLVHEASLKCLKERKWQVRDPEIGRGRMLGGHLLLPFKGF